MKLVIEMNLDNAAFREHEEGWADGTEIARILTRVAGFFDGHYYNERSGQYALYDANGNKVGETRIVKERRRK